MESPKAKPVFIVEIPNTLLADLDEKERGQASENLMAGLQTHLQGEYHVIIVAQPNINEYRFSILSDCSDKSVLNESQIELFLKKILT